MYLLGVVCLLSAAVALPTDEQLHTNLPELKPKEKDLNSNVDKPNPPLLDKPESEGAKNPLESAEKPKAEDKDKLSDDIKVIKKESKESEKSEDSRESEDSKEKFKDSTDSRESKDSKEKSKESNDFKEKSEESKESKESKPWENNEDIEVRPEEKKEEKKEKDSNCEESKGWNEEERPIIVSITNKPDLMGFISNWLPSIPNFHLPWKSSDFSSRFRNGGQQPVYIVRRFRLYFPD